MIELRVPHASERETKRVETKFEIKLHSCQLCLFIFFAALRNVLYLHMKVSIYKCIRQEEAIKRQSMRKEKIENTVL